jgi:NNP family nitrate/nitrite transporter-like MFS transporter
MLAALMGSGIRILGGYFADRMGGILVLSLVLLAAIGSFLALTATPSLAVTTLLFMLCFAALGAGNGALFQLVPLRWPTNTAVAGSMIGEVGALGGAILPNVMGFSKQYTGGFATGFVAYALFTGLVLGCLFLWQRKWVGAWVGPRGKVLDQPAEAQIQAGGRMEPANA